MPSYATSSPASRTTYDLQSGKFVIDSDYQFSKARLYMRNSSCSDLT